MQLGARHVLRQYAWKWAQVPALVADGVWEREIARRWG